MSNEKMTKWNGVVRFTCLECDAVTQTRYRDTWVDEYGDGPPYTWVPELEQKSCACGAKLEEVESICEDSLTVESNAVWTAANEVGSIIAPPV